MMDDVDRAKALLRRVFDTQISTMDANHLTASSTLTTIIRNEGKFPRTESMSHVRSLSARAAWAWSRPGYTSR